MLTYTKPFYHREITLSHRRPSPIILQLNLFLLFLFHPTTVNNNISVQYLQEEQPCFAKSWLPVLMIVVYYYFIFWATVLKILLFLE